MRMLRAFVSLFILIVFMASALDCTIELIVKGEGSCKMSVLGKCPQQGGSSEQAKDHHCHLPCTHHVIAGVKYSVIQTPVFEATTFEKNLALLYKNPHLESRKRPPLAA